MSQNRHFPTTDTDEDRCATNYKARPGKIYILLKSPFQKPVLINRNRNRSKKVKNWTRIFKTESVYALIIVGHGGRQTQ